MRRTWTATVLLGAGLLIPGTPVRCEPEAAADRAGSVVAGFQAWLDGTRELEGRFEQTLASGALGSGLEEAGRFYLSRPGRMRWDYLDPERKVAIVDGERTLLYIEEDAQLWEGTLDDGGLLGALLAGSRPLADVFEAEVVGIPVGADPSGTYDLRLVPREGDEAFRQVVVSLRPPELAIERAEVHDGSGNTMRYRFSDVRRNTGLAPGRFRFEPPPGTEVVRR